MGFSRQEYWSGLPCLQRCFIFVSVESLWTVARSLSHRQPWPSWMSSLQKLNCVDSSRSSPGCMRAEWYLISSSFRFQRGGLWSCLCIYLPSLGNASLSLTIPLHPSAWRPFFFQFKSNISSPSLSESTAQPFRGFMAPSLIRTTLGVSIFAYFMYFLFSVPCIS